MPNIELLKQLLTIQSVSGDETQMSEFLINYVTKRSFKYKVSPIIYKGEDFHDCILLKFGTPETAVFAHIDTIGFMVRYENQLVPIGGPEVIEGTFLLGEDGLGPVRCKVTEKDDNVYYEFGRAIQRGTNLSFEQDIRLTEDQIQAAYLDNRLGIYTALQLCETIENGWIVFSTYEEHGGGSMPFLLKFIQENAPIKQALISDVTWVTEGVKPNHGTVISIRDKFIPRKKFIDKILKLATDSGALFQLEVEGSGGSDGREVQFSPYPIDWCFIGPPEENVHSPNEQVSLNDLEATVALYRYLIQNL